jgi:hypothetical protein
MILSANDSLGNTIEHTLEHGRKAGQWLLGKLRQEDNLSLGAGIPV